MTKKINYLEAVKDESKIVVDDGGEKFFTGPRARLITRKSADKICAKCEYRKICDANALTDEEITCFTLYYRSRGLRLY